jgi:RimJ/RimL family protein N-acetyltransferase
MSIPFFAPERFVTPTFILRSYYPGDGALMSEAVNASYEHLSEFMAWATPNQSVETSEGLVRKMRADYLSNTDFVIGVFSPDESQLLGGTGFHLREGPLSSGNAEIGIWIRASEAGKGLGTAVTRAMLEWGFTEWEWTRLAWKCDVANSASRRTAERVGMTLEGTLRRYLPNHHGGAKRDSHYYAILKEEWSAQQGG